MYKYILYRIFRALIVIWLLSTIVFFVLRIIGDPVELLFSQSGMTGVEERKAIIEFYKLDMPLYMQYLNFIYEGIQGNMGYSFRFRQPAMTMLLERLPATLELTAAGIIFAIIFGSILGIIAALKPNTWIDQITIIISLLGQSIPVFWLGLMFIILFSVNLGWLPTSGRGEFVHLIMPAICLSNYPMASVARLLRSSMMDVMNQDYIRTARSKGLSETIIIIKHGIKNASIPVITVLGIQVSSLLGGAVVVETIFDWPGLGSLVFKAIALRDFTMVQAAAIILTVIVVIINLFVDIIYAYIDPRIRYN